MPINTAAKRRSASRRYLTPYPAADGVIDAGDRQQVRWLYRGIVVIPPVVVAIGNFRAHLTLRPAPRATLRLTGGS